MASWFWKAWSWLSEGAGSTRLWFLGRNCVGNWYLTSDSGGCESQWVWSHQLMESSMALMVYQLGGLLYGTFIASLTRSLGFCRVSNPRFSIILLTLLVR